MIGDAAWGGIFYHQQVYILWFEFWFWFPPGRTPTSSGSHLLRACSWLCAQRSLFYFLLLLLLIALFKHPGYKLFIIGFQSYNVPHPSPATDLSPVSLPPHLSLGQTICFSLTLSLPLPSSFIFDTVVCTIVNGELPCMSLSPLSVLSRVISFGYHCSSRPFSTLATLTCYLWRALYPGLDLHPDPCLRSLLVLLLGDCFNAKAQTQDGHIQVKCRTCQTIVLIPLFLRGGVEGSKFLYKSK